MSTEIFVSLTSEDVAVWRPVRAEHLYGDVYRILDQPYDRAIETWQFEPGDRVVCESIESSDGRILAATVLSSDGPGTQDDPEG